MIAVRVLVLLRNTDLEIQVRGQWDLQGDITILAMTTMVFFAKWWWRTTTVRMEGAGGNRGKACLSSERGISRRYRAKPYVPQIRRPYFDNGHLTQLSQLPHPDYRRSRVIRLASRNYLRASSRISWKAAIRLRDLLPRALHSFLFSSSRPKLHSIEKLAAEFRPRPWIYAIARDRKSAARYKPINWFR